MKQKKTLLVFLTIIATIMVAGCRHKTIILTGEPGQPTQQVEETKHEENGMVIEADQPVEAHEVSN